MARIVTVKKKNKRRKVDVLHMSITFFFVSLSLFFASTLFLRSYNNSLSTQKQSIDQQIATYEVQNDALQVEIQTLSSSDRVDEIAAGNGMSRNQDNVTTIQDGEQAE